MELREADPKDAESIFYIQKNTWVNVYPNNQHNITREDILHKFADKEKRVAKIKERMKRSEGVWVATQEEKVVGFASIAQEESKDSISAIYVLPEYQGQGIGKALLKKILEFYKNSKEIWLEVVSYNENAINFYQKHGFQVVPGTEGEHKVVENKYIPTIKMKREW